ncbi:hypothetical protein PN419_00135 [Halorubrum ezzemoulense]|uniref:hypothetical protein n=1 Tax=Halorubrum ezzemoulense TaxID=337243 RepID=UPI00232B03B7|nr:hypothetical protein [Halorubrum ezzemoulense]MDB9247415.1 hypothetical protein [Halorubrum ezzemoulense]MDB9258676.1 hypothetical protein [Halorubrum ezzemoulense]MDB9264466.1 hypothetical protein [Halorubrum ezzemoulense]MDB9269037.1 hypothetical protein [Halorubrum ezzemoulense]MDB9271434.1 hypothetical protein [Halorubrum ezzemoulense]
MPEDNLSDAEKELADTIDDAVRTALDEGVAIENVVACLDAHKTRLGVAAAEYGVDEGIIDEDEVPEELRAAQELLEADEGGA